MFFVERVQAQSRSSCPYATRLPRAFLKGVSGKRLQDTSGVLFFMATPMSLRPVVLRMSLRAGLLVCRSNNVPPDITVELGFHAADAQRKIRYLSCTS